MKIYLYSVKDTLSGFSQPFAAINDAVALRMFIGSVRAETPNIANTNAEDKEFWKLGELDDQTGELSQDLKRLACAATYVVAKSLKEVQDGTNEGCC